MTSLPSTTHITDICLRVRHLDATTDFYRQILGFKDLVSGTGERRLSASGNEPAQIILIEDRLAAPRRLSAPGLFHTAFLLPSRHSLAVSLKRLIAKEATVHGFADHGVSEAIYLADPEGNGVELYRDRPQDAWRRNNGTVSMVTDPLDVDGLLREPGTGGEPAFDLDPGTVLGHVHLQVSGLDKAEQFYHDLLGFDITQKSYPGALFLSAGGYHHHIGLNVWNSRDGIRTPGTAGLISFGICIPVQKEIAAIATKMEKQGFPVHRAESGHARIQDLDGITVHLSNTTITKDANTSILSQKD